jgi:hypothetical protein
MQELIKGIMDKAGISADAAKTLVSNVLGFLKGKLPESATNQLNAALGGALDKVGAQPASLGDAIKDSGVEPEKAPAALQALASQLKEKLPASVAGPVEQALAGDGLFKGLLNKVGSLFGK